VCAQPRQGMLTKAVRNGYCRSKCRGLVMAAPVHLAEVLWSSWEPRVPRVLLVSHYSIQEALQATAAANPSKLLELLIPRQPCAELAATAAALPYECICSKQTAVERTPVQHKSRWSQDIQRARKAAPRLLSCSGPSAGQARLAVQVQVCAPLEAAGRTAHRLCPH